MKAFMRWLISVAVIALGCSILAPSIAAAEEPGVEAEQRALLREGAKLWPVKCAGCHNARGPAERSPAEWETIVQHMRVRANIPGEESHAILEYLKRR
jgi:mono/diheme cytochrome c family protein